MTLDESLAYIENDLRQMNCHGKAYIFPPSKIYHNLNQAKHKSFSYWKLTVLEQEGYTKHVWFIPDEEIDRYLAYWKIEKYLVLDLDS